MRLVLITLSLTLSTLAFTQENSELSYCVDETFGSIYKVTAISNYDSLLKKNLENASAAQKPLILAQQKNLFALVAKMAQKACVATVGF